MQRGVILGQRSLPKWHGHISYSSALAKTIPQSTIKGGRRRGTQNRREDNIRQWTGLEFAKSWRAVENRRKKWRKLDAKSSVVPQQPSGSGDRWRWRSVVRGSFTGKYAGTCFRKKGGGGVLKQGWSLIRVIFHPGFPSIPHDNMTWNTLPHYTLVMLAGCCLG